jgi:tetratricopeptide (TPR) repeat protein
MTKLSLFLSGEKISETVLDPRNEYILGRSDTSDIILDNSEISRQHVRLKFQGGNWIAESISKYGRLVVNGAALEVLSLNNGMSFQIPPFDLHFSSETTEKVEATEVVRQTNFQAESFSDRTQAIHMKLKAILYRLDGDGVATEALTLGEGLIEAGRSRSSQVKLISEKASRKHFKMENDGSKVTLSDLGNSSHTYVNEKVISHCILNSGDEIRVGNEKFRFEFVDPNFEQAVNLTNNTQIAAKSDLPEQAVIKFTPPGYSNYLGNSRIPKKRPGLNPAFIAGIIVIVVLFIYLGVSENLKKSTTDRHLAGNLPSAPQNQGVSDKLTPEQHKFLEDTYNLAMNLYTSGRYDLSALEIEKILRIAPNYKDARNIQAYAQQALEIKKQKDEADRRQKELEVTARKVNDTLDECDKLLSRHRYNDVAPCVSRISDLDPENGRAENLVLAAKQQIELIEQTQEHKAFVKRRKAQVQAFFQKAQKEMNEKRYPSAIDSYQKAASLADRESGDVREKAKNGIQSAKQKIISTSDADFRDGKQALDAKEYKKAIIKLSEALRIYPQNGDAKISKERAESELHIEMKNIYSESVIDENIGNIEPAKKKWKQIIEQDVPADDYYQKAKIKLGKYEK